MEWIVLGNVWGFVRQIDEAKASQAEGLAWKRPHGVGHLGRGGRIRGFFGDVALAARGNVREDGCGERRHVFCASSRTVNSIFKPGAFQIRVCGDPNTPLGCLRSTLGREEQGGLTPSFNDSCSAFISYMCQIYT